MFKNFWTAILLGGVALAVACGGDDAPTATGTTDPVDRDAILGNLEDVRALLADNASNFDPMFIAGVSYDDEQLSVTLAESQDGLDLAVMQSMCRDLTESVALPDLTVVVETADGAESVECRLAE